MQSKSIVCSSARATRTNALGHDLAVVDPRVLLVEDLQVQVPALVQIHLVARKAQAPRAALVPEGFLGEDEDDRRRSLVVQEVRAPRLLGAPI